jgi:hypothetical protein
VRRTESSEKGTVKFRIVEFELKGDDDTLQEGLRSISSAINRATASAVPAAPRRTGALLDVAPTLTKNGRSEEQTEAPEDVDDAEVEVNEVEAVERAPVRRRPARPVRYPAPKTLDINFGVGDVSLKDFMGEKKPKSHTMKFLAVAAWFGSHGSVEEVTADHVYTAYQAMDWKSRKNMVQPFYVLRDNGWVTAGSSGAWKLTHIGRDKAKDLPAGQQG